MGLACSILGDLDQSFRAANRAGCCHELGYAPHEPDDIHRRRFHATGTSRPYQRSSSNGVGGPNANARRFARIYGNLIILGRRDTGRRIRGPPSQCPSDPVAGDQAHVRDVGALPGIQTFTGATLFNRKLRRSEVRPFFEKLPPCIVAMEACASSHSGREKSALWDIR